MRAACLLFLAACGRLHFTPIPGDATDDAPGDAGVGPEHSGTRLKLEWSEYADGTRQITGVYDSARGEECLFQAWAGGATYCMPAASWFAAYTDASCTQPIGWNPFGQQIPIAYAYESVPSCSGVAHLYPIGAMSAVTKFYTSDNISRCTGPFTAVPPAMALYTLGPEIDVASALASATIATPATSGRLATSYYETGDGFRMEATLHDQLLGTDCVHRSYDDGDDCEPTTASGGVLYHDAQCTQPELEAASACGPPSLGFAWAAGACTRQRPSYFAAGAAEAAPPLYSWNGTACASKTAMTEFEYYGVGASATVADLSLQPDQVAGRRIQIARFVGDAASLRTGAYDSMLATRCDALTASDGMLRCLPDVAIVQTFFSDAACTQPFSGVAVGGSLDCTPPAAPPFALSSNNDAFQIGPIASGTVYQAPNTPVASGTAVYTLGAELAPDQFVTAVTGRDP